MSKLALLMLFACSQNDSDGTATPPSTLPHDTGDTHQPQTPVEPGHLWVEVSTTPCARTDEGRVHCWVSETWVPVFVGGGIDLDKVHVGPSPVPMRSFYAHDTFPVTGIREDNGHLMTWWCGDNRDSLWASSWCSPPGDQVFREVSGTCGLTESGEIRHWYDHTVEEVGIPLDHTFSLFTAHGVRCGGMTADNIAFVGNPGSELPGALPNLTLQFPMNLTFTHITNQGAGLCALDSTGEITCLGPVRVPDEPDPLVFDHPPYTHVEGTRWGVCAARAQGPIDCSDGSSFDWGPIRDMAVWHFGYQMPGEPPVPPSVCAITVDNVIRCGGPRYPADLQVLPPPGWTPSASP